MAALVLPGLRMDGWVRVWTSCKRASDTCTFTQRRAGKRAAPLEDMLVNAQSSSNVRSYILQELIIAVVSNACSSDAIVAQGQHPGAPFSFL